MLNPPALIPASQPARILLPSHVPSVTAELLGAPSPAPCALRQCPQTPAHPLHPGKKSTGSHGKEVVFRAGMEQRKLSEPLRPNSSIPSTFPSCLAPPINHQRQIAGSCMLNAHTASPGGCLSRLTACLGFFPSLATITLWDLCGCQDGLCREDPAVPGQGWAAKHSRDRLAPCRDSSPTVCS